MAISGFVDESKEPAYVVACTFVESHRADAVRQTLCSLRLRGEQRLHFKSEHNDRRGHLVKAMLDLDVSVHVYVGNHPKHADSRRAALEALVEDSLSLGLQRLVIELDDSVMAADRRLLASRLRGEERAFHYAHLRPSQEPLLWVSDAVAWCWQKRSWRQRIRPLVAKEHEV